MKLRTVPSSVDVLLALRSEATNVFWVQLANILDAMGSPLGQIKLILMHLTNSGCHFDEEAVSRVHAALVDAGIIIPARRVRSA